MRDEVTIAAAGAESLSAGRGPRPRSNSVLVYVVRQFVHRALWVVPTLILVSFAVFFLIDRAPGDVAANIAGEGASPEAIEATRARLGLDRPLVERYLDWLTGALHGDFGTSYQTGESVGTLIAQALPITLSLVAVAFALAVLLGLVLGTLPYLVRRPWAHGFVSAVVSIFAAAQPLVVAIPLVGVVAVQYALLPAMGYQALSDGVAGWLKHLLLPGLALSLLPAGELARQLRAGLGDSLKAPFIVALHARGIPSRQVVVKHALRNAAIPTVTVLGVSIAGMFGATVIVEYLFLMDGLGRLAARAALVQDAPVVLGIAVITACIVSALGALVDASYAFFNPKVLVR